MKMFNKKLVALFLILAISVSFVACSNDGESGNNDETTTSVSESTSKKSSKESNKEDSDKNNESSSKSGTLKLNEVNKIDGYAKFSLQSITTTPDIYALAAYSKSYYNTTTGEIFIDCVFEVENISDGVIENQEFMVAEAQNSSDKKIKAELYATENERRTSVGSYGVINPGQTVYFHAVISVPTTDEVYDLIFKVKDKEYKINYKLNETLKEVIRLKIGDIHENPDYATLEFLNLEFKDELIADNAEKYTTKVSDSDNTFMILTFNITNYTEEEKDCYELISLFPVFDKKYTYEHDMYTLEKDGTHYDKNGEIAPLATKKVAVKIEIPKAAKEKSFEIKTVFDNKEFVIK